MAEVMTVNGPVAPGELGQTLAHVHVLASIGVTEQSTKASQGADTDQSLLERPPTMEELGYLRRHVHSRLGMLCLADEEEMVRELSYFKQAGGGAAVECSLPGMGRDPAGLRRISSETGVHIVCTTGWYIAPTHPKQVREQSADELADIMVRELTEGIGSTGVRAGALKVAISGPSPDVYFAGDEEKVLRAAARAQRKTGAPIISIHPCHHYGLARPHHAYIDVLTEEKAHIDRCVMSHLDLWSRENEYHRSILARGVMIAFDQFGNEYYGAPGKGYPPDRLRVEAVVALTRSGFSSQIVLSNEVAFRISLRRYGGYGYAHILENIVPEFRALGVEDEQIATMLTENPQRLLAFS